MYEEQWEDSEILVVKRLLESLLTDSKDVIENVMMADVGVIWYADEDNLKVEILNDAEKDFKDSRKWLDFIGDEVDTVPQLVCKGDEYRHTLLLKEAFQRDDCELEIVNVDILDKKYHWYKETNELNILFCIFKEQLIDFERLVWLDFNWGNEEEELMENEEEDNSVTDKLKWEEKTVELLLIDVSALNNVISIFEEKEDVDGRVSDNEELYCNAMDILEKEEGMDDDAIDRLKEVEDIVKFLWIEKENDSDEFIDRLEEKGNGDCWFLKDDGLVCETIDR